MSQAVELCSRAGRLFNMHLNDNYAGWDDDMIAGSVHLVEYLELLYTLRKIRYGGWCSIDIFPYRENAERATEESVAFLAACDRWVEKSEWRRYVRSFSAATSRKCSGRFA